MRFLVPAAALTRRWANLLAVAGCGRTRPVMVGSASLPRVTEICPEALLAAVHRMAAGRLAMSRPWGLPDAVAKASASSR